MAPDVVQQLRGALRVDEHGVVITTSHFTKAATIEANAAGKRPIALIDGPSLVEIGVRTKSVGLPTIDHEGMTSITADTSA
ncbi:MAG: restriction endonuclease [Candidatus Limnocylindrales bacterium]